MLDSILEEDVPRARLAVLLREFACIKDDRDPAYVVYPLSEVLLLLTCGSICGCDDTKDIIAWGRDHLGFLKRFSEFFHGIPSRRWMDNLINRVDPALFGACFASWIRALWPDRHDLIAIDGKTSRRTHDHRKGIKALHTLSAYASKARLVLAQRFVPEKTNEITAIPELLHDLAAAGQLEGALVTIDAMGTQVEIAEEIVALGADYLLPLKGNQPTLEAEVEDYFDTAPDSELVRTQTVEKGHGRIETRIYTASSVVDWIESERSYPGECRFKDIKTIMKVVCRTEYKDKCSFDTQYLISSAPLDIDRLAQAKRAHWGVESMHWNMDVTFAEDACRRRTGFGPKNMAIVRRFAFNLFRNDKTPGSIKTRRKRASWNPDFLLHILQLK